MTEEMIRVLTQVASDTEWDISINLDSNFVIFTYAGVYSYEIRINSLEMKEILKGIENKVYLFSAKSLTAEILERLDSTGVVLAEMPQSKVNEIYNHATLVGEKLIFLRDRLSLLACVA